MNLVSILSILTCDESNQKKIRFCSAKTGENVVFKRDGEYFHDFYLGDLPFGVVVRLFGQNRVSQCRMGDDGVAIYLRDIHDFEISF